MAINVIVTRKFCGDLQPVGFQNEAQMVEHFLTRLHFNDPEIQLEWLVKMRDELINGAISDFSDDHGISEKQL